MTQYVQLTPDGAEVFARFAGAQDPSDKPGYAEIDDDDPRYLAFEAKIAARGAVNRIFAAQIVSKKTPSLNGTYAIHDGARSNIAAIATAIATRKRLPGGGDTFNYLDISGTPHEFNAGQFLDFAAAVEDFAYALSTGEQPPQPIAIP